MNLYHNRFRIVPVLNSRLEIGICGKNWQEFSRFAQSFKLLPVASPSWILSLLSLETMTPKNPFSKRALDRQVILSLNTIRYRKKENDTNKIGRSFYAKQSIVTMSIVLDFFSIQLSLFRNQYRIPCSLNRR